MGMAAKRVVEGILVAVPSFALREVAGFAREPGVLIQQGYCRANGKRALVAVVENDTSGLAGYRGVIHA